jgi:hypothetical protein
MKRMWLLLLVVPVIMSLYGCILAAAAVGATGVLYYQGKASKNYPHPVMKTYDVVLAALKDAEIQVCEKGADATSGKIEGILQNGDKIHIKFDASGEDVTKVSIRIGTFGDRQKSEFIFGKIDKRM